jgi:hypothetical protein
MATEVTLNASVPVSVTRTCTCPPSAASVRSWTARASMPGTGGTAGPGDGAAADGDTDGDTDDEAADDPADDPADDDAAPQPAHSSSASAAGSAVGLALMRRRVGPAGSRYWCRAGSRAST